MGVIESVENPCRCLRSDSDTPGVPLGLAVCDPDDPQQRWQFLSLPVQAGAAPESRVQNWGRSASSACITAGPPPERLLLQAPCQDSAQQRWRFRDNATWAVRAMPW